MKFLYVILLGVLGLTWTAPVVGQEGLELRRAKSHPICYFFSLPKGYARTPDKKWPVLVVLTGSGFGFEELAQRYVQARGDLPVILVVPITLENNYYDFAGDIRARYLRVYDEATVPPPLDMREWDEAGFRAICLELRDSHDAEDRVYLSFFSAGGFVGFDLIVTHPEWLAGAGGVAPNFMYLSYRDRPLAYSAEDLTLPIRIWIGEDDDFRYLTKKRKRAHFKEWLMGAVPAVALGLFVGYRFKSRKLACCVGGAGVVLAALAVLSLPAGDWGLEAQADDATRLLEECGFTNIERTLVPDMDHDPAPALVIEAFKGNWK